MARTEAGYWMSVEPVDVVEPLNTETLGVALLVAIARGNPIVPTPSRQDFPRPGMERYCGLKSLSTFERSATLGHRGRRERLPDYRVEKK